MSRSFIRALRISPVVLLLLLPGCGAAPPSPATDIAPERGAEQAFDHGAYDEAARIWQQGAVGAATNAQAGAYRVRAADAWLLADQPTRARDLLKWISRSELDTWDRARLDLVLADLALRSGRLGEAQQLLEQAEPYLPRSARPRFETLSARARHVSSLPASRDISSVAALGRSIKSYEPRTALELINSLDGVSSGELAVRAENPRGERQLTGWLDLTLVIRQNLVVPDRITQSITDWKARHPHHVLTRSEALDLWLRYRQQFSPPRRVAVLLPDSGRFSHAGEAIRDGLMSAFLESPGGSEMHFFPVNDEPQSAISAYFSAMDSGADWIIGPLQKSSIEAMLNLAGLSTPVLALNDLPQGFSAPPGLTGQIVGFSLSQEKEAASAGLHAALSGYKRAIVLAPESGWGERMALAFQDEFLQEEREIVAAARYQESDNDHSAQIERLLKIDESKARKTRLERTLQRSLEFEPSRRDDVDVIFMAANVTQARLLRPQLRFYDAGDIPVYSTGRIYTGQPVRARNQDLNGIRFPITPWQLEHTEMEDLPNLASIRGGTMASLYAVGRDAWNLLLWLGLMQRDPDFRFPGSSGFYRMGTGGNLIREPAWARFRGGRPAVLDEVTARLGNR